MFDTSSQRFEVDQNICLSPPTLDEQTTHGVTIVSSADNTQTTAGFPGSGNEMSSASMTELLPVYMTTTGANTDSRSGVLSASGLSLPPISNAFVMPESSSASMTSLHSGNCANSGESRQINYSPLSDALNDLQETIYSAVLDEIDDATAVSLLDELRGETSLSLSSLQQTDSPNTSCSTFTSSSTSSNSQAQPNVSCHQYTNPTSSNFTTNTSTRQTYTPRPTQIDSCFGKDLKRLPSYDEHMKRRVEPKEEYTSSCSGQSSSSISKDILALLGLTKDDLRVTGKIERMFILFYCQ